MIRFNDAEEARKTKLLIDQLKQSKSGELEAEDKLLDRCSETETEFHNGSLDGMSDDCFSLKSTEMNSLGSKFNDTGDDWDGDFPLTSLIRPKKKIPKKRAPNTPSIPRVSPNKSPSRSTGNVTASRKRPRMILSDNEGEENEVYCSDRMVHNTPSRGVAAPVELMMKYPNSPVHEMKEGSRVASRCSVDVHSPFNLVKSTCLDVDHSASHSNVNATDEVHAPSDDRHQKVFFKIDGDWLHMDVNACVKLSIEQLKTEIACLYYLQLTRQKRSRGLVPLIEHIKYSGRILESTKALCDSNDETGNDWVEVSVSEMVPRHLMNLYVESCDELAISPSLEVVKNLYNPKLPDDVIIVSDCKLQDRSVAPLLKALQLHKSLAVLDLSHNQLGNETVENLMQIFISSGPNEGFLNLNLHNNRLGPTSLCHGGRALASLLRNLRCRFRILAVNKCQLGIVGVLFVLQALSTNISLQELSLTENVDSTENQTLTGSVREIDDDTSTVPEPRALQNDFDMNEDHLEVADSEDDKPDEKATKSIPEDGKICSSDKRSCLSRCSLMQLLTSSIKLTQKLQILDISQNGFSQEISEMLYSAWSSGHREGLACKHVDEKCLHFSVQGTKCCSIKSCCRRN